MASPCGEGRGAFSRGSGGGHRIAVVVPDALSLILALITALEWYWTINLCILALAIVLQVGKYFCYKPHSG